MEIRENSWIIISVWPSAMVEHELHGFHGFTRIILYLNFNSWVIKAGWPSAMVEHELTRISRIYAN